jgi:CRP-like cAMP-binding protein
MQSIRQYSFSKVSTVAKFAIVDTLNMKELINSLLRYNALNGYDIEMIKSKAQLKIIIKGDYFLETGKIAKQLGFVIEGVLRVCYLNDQGEDITRAFISENHFALNIPSFNNKTPSEVNFEAVSDCTLLVFSEKDLTELAAVISCWNDIFSKIVAAALTSKLKISNNMLIQDAKTRYLEFFKIYPGLANKVPLSALASYLGIKQSSLSRIRKNLT